MLIHMKITEKVTHFILSTYIYIYNNIICLIFSNFRTILQLYQNTKHALINYRFGLIRIKAHLTC